MKLTIDQLQTRRGTFVAGPMTAHLEAGDCLALMGANGAGKTTLLETLAGFFEPESGRISVDGTDVTTRVPERRHFAYLPQDLALFPHLSVTRNVGFASRGQHAQREIAALIDEFDLGPIRDLLPHQLSHGQAQRVALARALATCPQLLLLDEPTASLDVPGRKGFDAHMRRILAAHELIAIYATHNVIDSLSLATHLVILDHGRVSQAGAPDALFREPANTHVAELLGITNVWPVRAVERSAGAIVARIEGGKLVCTREPAPQDPGFAAIGPGEVELDVHAPTDPRNCFEASVQTLQVSGQAALVDLACSLGGVRAALPPWRTSEISIGQQVWVRLPADRVRLIPAPQAH